MTEHLPKCPMLEPFSADETQHCFCTRKNPCIHDEMECICERLSAEEIGDDDFPIFTTNLNHLIDRGYPRGYADGLNAAREALKHIQHSDDCYYAEGVLCHCEIKSAIAAIDALREEKE